MIRGTAPYTAAGKVPCAIQTEIQISGNNRWLSARDLGDEAGVIWGEYIVDLTSREDVEHLRLSFEMDVDLAHFDGAFSPARLDEYFEFGVRLWNKSTRRREFRRGSMERRRGAGRRAGSLCCYLSQLHLTVKDFGGEIELEPVLVVRADRVLDVATNTTLTRGSLIAWAEPLVVVLDRVRKGLDSLFEFLWRSFSENPPDPAPEVGSFFAVSWERAPKLYLNIDVPGLQPLLLSDSKKGASPQASMRRVVNCVIAHQVLSTGLSAAMYQAMSIHRSNPDLSGEEVFGLLDEQNRAILRSWIGVLGGDRSRRPEDQLAALLTVDDPQELSRRIAEIVPTGIQSAFNTSRAIAGLIDPAADGPSAGIVSRLPT
jgi:hypothetical protein